MKSVVSNIDRNLKRMQHIDTSKKPDETVNEARIRITDSVAQSVKLLSIHTNSLTDKIISLIKEITVIKNKRHSDKKRKGGKRVKRRNDPASVALSIKESSNVLQSSKLPSSRNEMSIKIGGDVAENSIKSMTENNEPLITISKVKEYLDEINLKVNEKKAKIENQIKKPHIFSINSSICFDSSTECQYFNKPIKIDCVYDLFNKDIRKLLNTDIPYIEFTVKRNIKSKYDSIELNEIGIIRKDTSLLYKQESQSFSIHSASTEGKDIPCLPMPISDIDIIPETNEPTHTYTCPTVRNLELENVLAPLKQERIELQSTFNSKSLLRRAFLVCLTNFQDGYFYLYQEYPFGVIIKKSI